MNYGAPLLPPIIGPLPSCPVHAPVGRRHAATWRAWPADQLWLWPDLVGPGPRDRMRAAVATALTDLSTSDLADLERLAAAGEPGAALRRAARCLCGRGAGGPFAADIAAVALLLAALEHDDDRAALEFAVLASHRARCVRLSPAAAVGYPPPLNRAGRLRRRMVRQAGWLLALAVARGRLDWEGALVGVARLQAGDPLGGDAAGTEGQR